MALYCKTSAVQGKLVRSVACPAGCWALSGAFHCARYSMQCDAVLPRGRMQWNPDDANCTSFATSELNQALQHNLFATHQVEVDTCVLDMY